MMSKNSKDSSEKKRDKQNIQKFWREKDINKKYFNFCQFLYIIENSLLYNAK